MHLKISSAKWQPFRPGGDELSLVLNPLAIYIINYYQRPVSHPGHCVTEVNSMLVTN